MHRFGVRLFISCLAIVFAILFGVELASTDVGYIDAGVHEPAVKTTAQVLTAEELKQEMEQELGQVIRTDEDELELSQSTAQNDGVDTNSYTVIEKIASSAGSLLRKAAQLGVEAFVGMINGLLN